MQPLASSSLNVADDEGRWFRFVRTFFLVGFGGLAILLVIIFVSDPYDSGHFPFALIAGTPDKDSRFANASHGRDLRFNAAIFGNSHGQALNPERLSSAAGMNFVQMTVAGASPREQLVLMKWFAHHHATIGSIVLVVDDWWCTHDPALPIRYEFPFWLYSGSILDYLPKLLTTQSFDRATRRMALALGLAKVADPTGFDDYEAGVNWSFAPAPDDRPTADASGGLQKQPDKYPAIEQLEATLSAFSRDFPVVLVMPYVYSTVLPKPQTEAAADINNCKAAFANMINKRPRASFLDMRLDSPLARDPKNFMDNTHYRKNLAIIIENRIASALGATAHH